MPYSLTDFPDKLSTMPEACKKIWIAAYNSAHTQYDGDEEKANATAYSAVAKAGFVKEDDKWVKKTNAELYLLPLGQAEKVELEGGNLFKKKLIEVGEWVYPQDSKKRLKITAEKIDNYIAKFKEGYAKVFIPKRHSIDPEDNRGWLKGLERKGKALFGIVDITHSKMADRLREGTVADVSLGIHPNYKDGKGKKWGEVIEHIALTLIPHIKEQGEGEDGAFVPLEIEGREVICMERVEEKDETVLKDFAGLKDVLVKLESNLVKAIKEGGEKIMTEKEKKEEQEGKGAENQEKKEEQHSVTELERQKIKDAQEKVTMLETEVNSLRDYRERKEVEEIDGKLQVLLESAKITPAIKDRLRGVVLASRTTKIELEGKQQPMNDEILSILAELPAQVDTNEYSKTELERPASGTVDAEAESNRILEGKAPEK